MRSKYNNIKTIIDGITFDSRAEANRYCELKLMVRGGRITDLKLQHKFEILPKSRSGRALYYIADFCYLEDGKLVVEDVKGVATAVYKLKKRLVAEKYGIQITEVRR